MKKSKFSAWLFRYFRGRTVLSVISVAIGVASVMLIGYIGDSGTAAVNKELDTLGMDGLTIYAESGVSGSVLRTKDLQTIEQNPNVLSAEPLMVLGAEINSGRNRATAATVWGIREDVSVMKFDIFHGRQIKTSDIKAKANVCMVDAELAKTLYGRTNITGKKISMTINSITQEYDIIGVVKCSSGIVNNVVGSVIPSFVYIPYSTFQLSAGTDTLDRIAVKIKDGYEIQQVSDSIIRSLELSNGYKEIYSSQNLAVQRESLQNLLSIVTLVLSVIGGISLFVAGLGIMTVMLVSVNEKTREIGIKKAIGAKNGNILFEFIFEAFSIAFLGSVVGIIIGTSVFLAAALFLKISFFFAYIRCIACMTVSIIIGCVFGAYPAYKAASMKPVEALRRD